MMCCFLYYKGTEMRANHNEVNKSILRYKTVFYYWRYNQECIGVNLLSWLYKRSCFWYCQRISLLLQLIHFHPVNLHLDRIFFRVGFTYPRTFYLHVNKQVVRSSKRVLSFLVGFNLGISKGMIPIYGEHQTVGKYLHGIYIISVGINLTDSTLFGIIFVLQCATRSRTSNCSAWCLNLLFRQQ